MWFIETLLVHRREYFFLFVALTVLFNFVSIFLTKVINKILAIKLKDKRLKDCRFLI